ncbi:hypothetical protein K9M42_00205 [Patescibacteria group bacterium]|nr:hypothetical protein [Patescibacteria group bacterium]
MIIGFYLIAFGILFLIQNLGYLDLNNIINIFWPTLFLIIPGILTLYKNKKFSYILLIIGSFIQINQLNIFKKLDEFFWPLLLIFFGFSIIYSHKNNKITKKRNKKDKYFYSEKKDLDASALFSGTSQKIKNNNFKSGRISSYFGGVKVDLRDCKINKEGAVIDIDCAFAGIEILIPKNTKVIYKNTPIFGGFEDLTKNKKETEYEIYIKGSIAFGGVEIKN